LNKQKVHHLVSGGNDPFLPKLLDAINTAKKISFTVAFVRQAGLLLIFDALKEALQRKVDIRILTGDYLNVTEPSALRMLLLLQEAGAEVRVFEAKNRQSFHMKAYIFTFQDQSGERSGCAYIGSSNISSSALQQGLEWNLMVSQEENPERFDEFCRKFEEIFNHPDTILLSNAWIDQYQERVKSLPVLLFPEPGDVIPPREPNAVQQEALQALEHTRLAGYRRGLVVMATGLGKTWLAAFDSLAVNSKRILFVAHREEILDQAESTFVCIRPECRVGRYTGEKQELDADMLFASIQTLGRKHHLEKFPVDHFDYIIVDEFHHASARTYRQLLKHFQPRFLLGLTATPERMDHADILSLCDDNLVFRCDLFSGIHDGLLCPFHYFGIADKEVDYQAIPWRNGKFDPEQLSNQLATRARAKHALTSWKQHRQTRTLAFCVSKKHADFMARYFINDGYRAVSVHSDSTVPRNEALSKLKNGELDVVFSVDLFNEGVDLPLIDTILMLRPTESKIIFLQQLGRGLRTAPEKEHLTVLDFIGNHISFFRKPEGLFNFGCSKKERRKFIEQIRNDHLNLPKGCFVNYDIQAIDFLAKLIRGSKEKEENLYRALKESKGRRPTLVEFSQAGGKIDAIRTHFSYWFNFIAAERDLSADEMDCIKQNESFLTELETTNLTKSYKIVLLDALIELNGFSQPVSTVDLAKRCFAIIQRRHILLGDLPEKFRNQDQLEGQDIDRWHQYWLGNPVNAWAGGNRKGAEQAFFKLKGGQFVFQGDVPEYQMDVFLGFVLELLDYRYLQYQERLQKKSQKPVVEKAEVISIETAKKVNLRYFPDLRIACGHFRFSHPDEENSNHILLPESYGRLDPSRHFVARAKGNSMDGGKMPIKDGDYLLLELITSESAGSISNQIVAIERQDVSGDDQYLLRYVRKLGAGKYELLANNPDYQPLLATEDMRTFARFKEVIVPDDLDIAAQR